MFVLGIDPGLTRCGYCVLSTDGDARAMGVLRTSPDAAVPARLAELSADVRGLMDEFPPVAVAVERVLFQSNVRTAMGVGQASGVVMVAAAERGVPVVEYSPNQVKGAVAGHGAADKEQVQRMVQVLLGLDVPPRPADAADAAAIALTHLAMSGGRVRPARTARSVGPVGGPA